MNGADKAFPIITTSWEIEQGQIKHLVQSSGGLTKREFATVMIACGFVANGRPYTVSDLEAEVNKTMAAS